MTANLQTNSHKVFIESYESRTVFGSAKETLLQLNNGISGLAATDAFGCEKNEEPVPLALINKMQEAVPPRWWDNLQSLLSNTPKGLPWGTIDYPVIVTSSNFGIDSLYYYRQTPNASFIPNSIAHLSVEQIAKSQNWGTHCPIFSHACVSAHLGLYQASQMLKHRRAEKVLLVSYDYLSPFVTGGFHALKILNEQFPAPYEKRDIGAIALGDGAAFMVLSNQPTMFCIEHQVLHNEMYHFTSNQPEASGFATIAQSLKTAAKNRSLWIKGHGTGTLEAGSMEAEQFAKHFPTSPLVSWKGSLGHTLGSCGLIELTLACEAMKVGKTPGTIGTNGPCFSEQVARESLGNSHFDSAIIASNAFGGAHAALLLTHG